MAQAVIMIRLKSQQTREITKKIQKYKTAKDAVWDNEFQCRQRTTAIVAVHNAAVMRYFRRPHACIPDGPVEIPD